MEPLNDVHENENGMNKRYYWLAVPIAFLAWYVLRDKAPSAVDNGIDSTPLKGQRADPEPNRHTFPGSKKPRALVKPRIAVIDDDPRGKLLFAKLAKNSKLQDLGRFEPEIEANVLITVQKKVSTAQLKFSQEGSRPLVESEDESPQLREEDPATDLALQKLKLRAFKKGHYWTFHSGSGMSALSLMSKYQRQVTSVLIGQCRDIKGTRRDTVVYFSTRDFNNLQDQMR